jgi:hypothetical protein
MLVATIAHLSNKRLMPAKERLQLPLPPQCLRMMGIALFAIRKHRPNRVQLPMLTQQVGSTESPWGDIPNSHC